MAVQTSVGRFCTLWSNCRNVLTNRNHFINCPQRATFISKTVINELTEKLKNLNIPDKPKRPLTPYFRYMALIRAEIKAKQPDKNAIDVVRQVAIQWETVDEQTKRKLYDEYKIDQQQYSKEILSYEAKLSSEQRHVMSELKKANTERNAKVKNKKLMVELGKPKRAPSAYMFFVSEFNQKRGSQSLGDFQRNIAAKWNALSDAEKKPYVDKSMAQRKVYAQEMEQWEYRMLKEGNQNVVRKALVLNKSVRTSKKNKIALQ